MMIESIECDLGHLVGSRVDPLEETIDEEYLFDLAEEGTQAIVNGLFKLDTEAAESGRIAKLPKPVEVLPREKPVPGPPVLTKWEQFRRSRGIVNTKKDRLVWDENHEEYRPRYGKGRANDEQDQWVIEHKKDFNEQDPFSKMASERKIRSSQNKKSKVENLLRAEGTRIPGAVDLSTAVDMARPRKKAKVSGQKGSHLKTALQMAQLSTASMGRFDNKQRGEAEVRAPKTAKTYASGQAGAISARVPGSSDVHSEKESSLKILNRISGSKAPKATRDVKMRGVATVKKNVASSARNGNMKRAKTKGPRSTHTAPAHAPKAAQFKKRNRK